MIKNKPPGIPSAPTAPQPPVLPSVPSVPSPPQVPEFPKAWLDKARNGAANGKWPPIPPGVFERMAFGPKIDPSAATGPDIARIVERVSKIVAAVRDGSPAGAGASLDQRGLSPERIAELIKKYGPKAA